MLTIAQRKVVEVDSTRSPGEIGALAPNMYIVQIEGFSKSYGIFGFSNRLRKGGPINVCPPIFRLDLPGFPLNM